MSYIYLPQKASKARRREAENARKNRAEIVRAYSQGKVSRRDLIKWGLITSGGLLAPIHGLNPFVTSAYARWRQQHSHRRTAKPAVRRPGFHPTHASF